MLIFSRVAFFPGVEQSLIYEMEEIGV